MAFQSGMPLSFKWPYQAMVIKIFDARSNKIVRIYNKVSGSKLPVFLTVKSPGAQRGAKIFFATETQKPPRKIQCAITNIFCVPQCFCGYFFLPMRQKATAENTM